jgi:hypothetical protein
MRILTLLAIAALLVLPLAAAGPLTDAGHTVQGVTDPVAECVGSGACLHPCPHDDCSGLADEAEERVAQAGQDALLIVCGPVGCVAFANEEAAAVLALAGGLVGGPLDGAVALVNDTLGTVDPEATVALVNSTTNGAYAQATGAIVGAYTAAYATGGSLASKADATVPWWTAVNCRDYVSSSLGCTLWMHRNDHLPNPFT